ncbi:MAG TPA: deaminase [Candidatus Saccharimonadales bacterium]|nr:deaminase [Candidatus Saccharimonadales bacterium]
MNDYLRQAVNLSRKSFEAGEFPAGAILVTEAGNVYESDPSLPHYHGECMVIDKAIRAEGYPLTGAVMYGSMESCLMCSAKMYWAGITEVHFVIPKEKTNTLYAYEDDLPMQGRIKQFNTPITATQDSGLLDEALGLYEAWVKKIENK